MTWEEKLEACNALARCGLSMRKPGDWYVYQSGVELKRGCMLGGGGGNGTTPELAVLDHWEGHTNLQPGEYLVIGAMTPNRRAVKWNGYMWATVDEPKKGE